MIPRWVGRALALALVTALAATVLAQELRWHLHDPFHLSGISHAVGIPVGVPLTAGFVIQNHQRLPLTVEAIDVVGDAHRESITQTYRLDVTRIAALPGERPAPARAGTPFELGLSTRPTEGRTVAHGESLSLAVTFVGTGAHRFRAGPIVVRYRYGPFVREQRISLSRGYQITVTAPDATRERANAGTEH